MLNMQYYNRLIENALHKIEYSLMDKNKLNQDKIRYNFADPTPEKLHCFVLLHNRKYRPQYK